MAQATVPRPARRASAGDPVRLRELAECVRRLDPATRALLDLSVRRARALERVATELGHDGQPAPLGEVRMALEALPREAWGLPGMGPAALPPGRSGPSGERPRPAPQPSAAPSASHEHEHAAGSALVPAASASLAGPAPGRLARLDAFASSSPPLRLALRQLGRAMAAKAVRIVVWRRPR
jgi:hypothetical protein